MFSLPIYLQPFLIHFVGKALIDLWIKTYCYRMSSCILPTNVYVFFFLLNKLNIVFKIAEGSFSIYFNFIMMNLIAFIASFMFFVIFAKVD